MISGMCVLQVVMYDCFRPGDVVRAKVLSLGDARSYYLTTADNTLGVVHAKSLAGGEVLVLVSSLMLCKSKRGKVGASFVKWGVAAWDRAVV